MYPHARDGVGGPEPKHPRIKASKQPRGSPKVDAHDDQIGGRNNKGKSKWNRNKYDVPEKHQHFYIWRDIVPWNQWESLDEPSDHT